MEIFAKVHLPDRSYEYLVTAKENLDTYPLQEIDKGTIERGCVGFYMQDVYKLYFLDQYNLSPLFVTEGVTAIMFSKLQGLCGILEQVAKEKAETLACDALAGYLRRRLIDAMRDGMKPRFLRRLLTDFMDIWMLSSLWEIGDLQETDWTKIQAKVKADPWMKEAAFWLSRSTVWDVQRDYIKRIFVRQIENM